MNKDERAERIRIIEQQIKPQLGITKKLLSIAAALLLLLTIGLLLRLNLTEDKDLEGVGATHLLEFNDTPMDEVFSQISKLYEIEFEIESININKCFFTSKMDHLEIEEILRTIKFAVEIEFEKISDLKYLVKGVNCQ